MEGEYIYIMLYEIDVALEQIPSMIYKVRVLENKLFRKRDGSIV